MIPETALALAAPGSVLCGRPRGVAHIYQGPLTPSGRYIPRSGRTACRTPHRRLAVLPVERSSLDAATRRRVCARCSARLLSLSGRRAEPQPVTRDEFRAAYAARTPGDLAVDVEVAKTAEELDAAAHLSLVLFGHRVCAQTSLHTRIARRRREFRPYPLLGEDFDDQVKADRRNRGAELHRIREDRIAALGFNNAIR